jgi:hypothetical protein
MINTILFFAVWALIALGIVVITMYYIMTPIHEKQRVLQEDMKKNDVLLESLINER